jgi:membrane-associated protein
MKSPIRARTHWKTAVLVVLLVVAALAALRFGNRTYRSYLLLRSAYELGEPDVSSVRAWMTFRYVAATYRVSEADLIERLGLPSQIDPQTTLRSVAERRGLTPFAYVRQIQESISDLHSLSAVPSKEAENSKGAAGEQSLSALLIYGYPALGLTLLLGAVGVPLPTSLSMVVSGSLAAQGYMSWYWASVVAVSGSVLGDSAGYGLGYLVGGEIFDRRGRWFGFTPALRARVELLFQQWGMLSVILSRSLLSFLSSAVNLLAGAGHYPLRLFLPSSVVGRLIWTSAYLGLGYSVGAAIEASSSFLSNLSGLLVSLAALGGLGFMLYQNHARLRPVEFQTPPG